MEAADGDDEKPSFRCGCRCLDVARYALAAVMTLLIVSITFNTVKLVLYEQSHDPVRLSVARGLVVCAAATIGGDDSPALMLYHGLRVSSDHGFSYYAANVTACLFAFNVTKGLDDEPFFCFRPNGTVRAVQQREQSYLLMEAAATRRTVMPEPYFVRLHNISSGSLGVRGTFIAERRSGRLNTTSWNVYDCGFVNVAGLERSNSKNDDDLLLDLRYDDRTCVPVA
uniref:Uncharacterized protein n=1 Tax=Setaria italica TaxID=4555 RepID=K3Y9W1_SETIT